MDECSRNLLEEYDGLQNVQEFSIKLPITNDSAERNVKLIQEFVNSCHDEPLKQDILLALDSTKRKAGRPKTGIKKKRKM